MSPRQTPTRLVQHSEVSDAGQVNFSNGTASAHEYQSISPPSSEASNPVGSDHYLPRLLAPSECIRPENVLPLEAALPVEYRGYDWQLAFSTTQHGFNLPIFFQNCASHHASLLFVKDGENVFGGFATEPWVCFFP